MNHILGGSTFTSRLYRAVREQRGLVYTSSINGGMSRHPYGNYSINIGLPTAPENVDKAIETTFAEVRKLQEKGPDEADLAKVKENWTTNYRKRCVKTAGGSPACNPRW